jgi:hypothetical protein
MNEDPNSPNPPSGTGDAAAESSQPHPIAVIRQLLDREEWAFEGDDDSLRFRLSLDTQDVEMVCTGEVGNIVVLCLQSPLRAPKDRRAAVGEFLHRLNYAAVRKVWEMDYDDGEIRLHLFTDVVNAPLSEGLFKAMLNFLCFQADAAFPYLTAVLNGQMIPQFAADQALAAMGDHGEDE